MLLQPAEMGQCHQGGPGLAYAEPGRGSHPETATVLSPLHRCWVPWGAAMLVPSRAAPMMLGCPVSTVTNPSDLKARQ